MHILIVILMSFFSVAHILPFLLFAKLFCYIPSRNQLFSVSLLRLAQPMPPFPFPLLRSSLSKTKKHFTLSLGSFMSLSAEGSFSVFCHAPLEIVNCAFFCHRALSPVSFLVDSCSCCRPVSGVVLLDLISCLPAFIVS